MAVAIFGHPMHVKLVAEFLILQSISKDNLVHQIKAVCRNIHSNTPESSRMHIIRDGSLACFGRLMQKFLPFLASILQPVNSFLLFQDRPFS